MTSRSGRTSDENHVPQRAWKPTSGRSRSTSIAEQDRAAGGRAHRRVDLGDGRTAYAMVELRPVAGGTRVGAMLRWKDRGRRKSKDLGHVTGSSRTHNLAEAFRKAHAEGFLVDAGTGPNSWASSPAVRASMQGNRGRDTRPELRLRSLLHQEGLRYRVSTRPVPNIRRTADVVFPRARVAVFVDGCFWHGCPEHHRSARSNATFWHEKIEGNRQRDRDTDRLLGEAGWTVIRVWEHEDPSVAAGRVVTALAPDAHGKRRG